ncbi:hypothetical protein C5167_044446 [Papaver somniferum]|uniref:Uncharacterized protein n=1 Tax=Papaver somniferum TaxID=3469 RepID=A0A4Y7LC43_PAPSO|nr:hypothetical protein C5167_044446 [Papaver somniferum]
MATRKSRSINNKQFGKLNEESPDKDGGSGGNKSRQKKRKLTDMLGPQWSMLLSNNGCFSVKKRRTSVKRTPRYPVSHTSDKHEREKFVTPSKRGLNSDLDVHGEEGGSPQVSQTPKRRSEHLRTSSSHKSERRKQLDWDKSSTKHRGITDENYLEDSLGSREAENGDFYRNSSYMMDARGVGTVGVQNKGKKSLGRKPKDIENCHRDEDREACTGSEKGLNLSYVKEQAKNEVTDPRYGRPRKKNKDLIEDAY